MGTSAPYPGPSGVNPLLPPWADEGDGDGLPPPAPEPGVEPAPQGSPQGPPAPTSPVPPPLPTIPWSVPKGRLTRAAHGGGGVRSALGGYVQASGGAGGASERARSGRRTFSRAATFLGLASREGLAAAARQLLGLTQLVGRDVQTVLVDLAGRLAPAGATNEEAAARAALLETFSAFAEELAGAGQGLDALDHLDAAGIGGVLREFVTNYVSERFLQELGVQIDRDRISVTDAQELFREVCAAVRATVQVDFKNVDATTFDWAGPEGRVRVGRIFREAYSLIEDL